MGKTGAVSTAPVSTVRDGMKVASGGFSCAGLKARNDDAFAAEMPVTPGVALMKGAVACIADGVSESDRSHLASQLSVTQFIEDYYATPDSWSVEESAARVLRSINDWLTGQSRQANAGAMVTTFSAAIIKSRTLHIIHVGDSRIYRLRDAQIELLTTDHAISISPGKQMLSAALGMDARLNVDYSQLDAREGDIVFLATDGITESLTPEDIIFHLARCRGEVRDLDIVAEEICKLALAKGSKDNLTCGILVIERLPEESMEEAHARLRQRAIPPVMSVGNRIDDFRVLRVIHSGTRSHIYEVVDERSNEKFALKAPSRNFADDSLYLEGFAREQWVGRRLDHPGLMKVYPRSEASTFLYLVCELVPGQTLRGWMQDHPTPPLSEVRAIAEGIVLALRALHRMGMVHRDIKPENIMITHQGDVKIIDYGTVQAAGLDEVASPLSETHAVGSVAYSAPEYVLGRKATPQSDLFSLGVVTYELLTGRRPYELSDGARHKWTLATWGHKSAHVIRPGIPLWVSAALEKACAPNPEFRHAAQSEFLADLKAPGEYARRKVTETSLLDRNPLAFWKGLSVLLFITTVILAVQLMQPTN
ncbi:bifunctional protein-serine/threonine kinase/phosphatase [Hyphomonas sp.]|uniref:bifunctional protein-serine/threonine kinase/phosphatase n=1 Tax=Hyphomonas sp. TaxID=87 RepID=UPI0030015FFB